MYERKVIFLGVARAAAAVCGCNNNKRLRDARHQRAKDIVVTGSNFPTRACRTHCWCAYRVACNGICDFYSFISLVVMNVEDVFPLRVFSIDAGVG